jgi:hypothetical protein
MATIMFHLLNHVKNFDRVWFRTRRSWEGFISVHSEQYNSSFTHGSNRTRFGHINRWYAYVTKHVSHKYLYSKVEMFVYGVYFTKYRGKTT